MSHSFEERMSVRDQKLLKFVRGFREHKEKDALSIWKQRMFEIVKERRDHVAQLKMHSTGNSDIHRKKEISQQAKEYCFKTTSMLMKRVFIALFDYRAKRMTKRHDQERLEDKLLFLRKRFQFQKWVLRSDQTIIFRQKEKNLLKSWHRGRKQSIFKAL